MVPPLICSRMKQAKELARLWIEPRNVGPFEAIAMDAGESKILLLIFAAVLAGDDVVDLKWSRMYSSGQLTVFTSRTGSLPNPANELRIQRG